MDMFLRGNSSRGSWEKGRKHEAAEARSPALAELLGLQEESSYGKLLRTMPRGLKDELGSVSS